MPDNTILNPGVGGDTIATDDIGGVKHELVKLEFGADGSATMVDPSNPLPTADAIAQAALASIAAEDFATQATLAALLAKVIAAPSTEAKQDAMIGFLTTIAAITQPLTDAQLRASAVPVTISGGGGGAATIADGADVTEGAIADAIVAAGAAGTLSAKLRRISQGLEDLKTLITVLPLPTGAATVANQQTDALTNTQLRATPVPVSGTITTGGLTDAELRASAVPIIEAAPTTIFNGKTTVATAGTRVVLAASQAVKSVTLKAALANTGIIYVGNSTVAAANGFELSAGDTVSIDIANLNTVNIDSSVSGESVLYIGVN